MSHALQPNHERKTQHTMAIYVVKTVRTVSCSLFVFANGPSTLHNFNDGQFYLDLHHILSLYVQECTASLTFDLCYSFH